MCLTPSSVAYDTMTLDDLVVVDLDGTVVEGTRSPTTEKDLHLATLRRYPELGAVIHTHAVYATMFALAHEPIPAVIEEVVVYLGGDVPCCDYKGTGTADLGDEVAARLADRGPRCSPTTAWSPAGRRPRRRSTTPPSSSGPPRSCGAPGPWAATIHPLPGQGRHRHGRRLPLPPGQPVTVTGDNPVTARHGATGRRRRRAPPWWAGPQRSRRCWGPGRLEVEEVPEVGDHDVLVAVDLCGVCGTTCTWSSTAGASPAAGAATSGSAGSPPSATA